MKNRKFFLVVGGVLGVVVLLAAQTASASSPVPAAAALPPQLVAADECPVRPVEASKDFPRFARLMHDPQWMPWPSRMGDPDWPKGFHYQWYPETVPLLGNPRGTKASVTYSVEWLQFLRELQPNDKSAVWIARVAAGLFNNGNSFIPILELEQLQDEPLAAAVSSGGNVVKVVEIKNGSGRIELIYFKSAIPDPAEINYQKTPWLVTKFTSISDKGELGNAGGIDVYFPNLSTKEDGYWVEMRRAELFPQVPSCVTAEGPVSVLNTIEGYAKEVVAYEEGDTIVIYEYLPQGSNVWGRTDQGWLLLEYLNAAGRPVYPTSWEMGTRPPILFP